jgi:hypothetical protein
MKKLLFLVTFAIILLPICSAAHYIIGVVDNAKDGKNADGHSITLWDPAIGINNNISDIIGPLGNSYTNNIYMMDCELLTNGCEIGDILSLRITNNGDNYISEDKSITITGAGYDVVDNIILNSPPETDLIFPLDFAYLSNSQVNFNCSYLDLDKNLKEISLYANWTGEWTLNETRNIELDDEFTIFTKNIPEGFYKYGCKVTDNLSISSFSSENNSFTIDWTKPVIDSIFENISSSCGKSNSIRINCTTHDELSGIDKVLIQAISPSGTKNYSTSSLTGNTYYSDIKLNETGSWNFNCISNDSAGNIKFLNSSEIQVRSSFPELFVNFSNINLSELNPIENQSVKINAIIENLGCGNVENLLIGFFDGDPFISGKNIGNATINISETSFTATNINWNAKIGPTNIFVFADYNLLIEEDNESNNKANKTISVNSWQEIYGNTSVDKIIGGEDNNIKKWFNGSNLEGNVFITDSESSINWLSLEAIGKTKQGTKSSNDFLDIDTILNTINFEDSVSNVFSENQNPKETKNMIIHQKEIKNVPIINSTNNSKFVTGILWDTSYDTNGEFDQGDREEIVFVTPIDKQSEGAYGFYDYEMKIPSKLREYNNLDSQEIYLYYDLN